MVECLFDGLYLDTTLPLLTQLLILLLRLHYIDAWWKLVLPGLWEECCVCDLGAWRVRVVSTELE